jgi:hypothetical protein
VAININWGKVIMGLDNISPWFSWEVNLWRTFNSGNFFEFGPLLLNPVIHLLGLFSFPAWINSHLYIWGAFVLGIYFYYRNYKLLFRGGLRFEELLLGFVARKVSFSALMTYLFCGILFVCSFP